MLRTDRLDVYYGLFQALFSLSFQVGPGETVALIGSNGAGKTTTMRAIFGLVEPDSGEVLWDRHPVRLALDGDRRDLRSSLLRGDSAGLSYPQGPG